MKTLVGKVVSDRMQKSVLVSIKRFKEMAKYKTRLPRDTKVMAHDEHDSCRIGDTVRVATSRPLSRHKAHVVTEILQRAPVFDMRKAAEAAELAGQTARSPESSSDPAAVLRPKAPPSRGFASSALP